MSADRIPVYVIREGLPTDAPYVGKTWLGEYLGSSDYAHQFGTGANRGDALRHYCEPIVRRILQRAEVRIACLPDDSDTIVGFAVLEPCAVHMVYARPAWRNYGIATTLLEGVDLRRCVYTTPTSDFAEWVKHRWPMKACVPFWMDGSDVAEVAALFVEGPHLKKLAARMRRAMPDAEVPAAPDTERAKYG